MYIVGSTKGTVKKFFGNVKPYAAGPLLHSSFLIAIMAMFVLYGGQQTNLALIVAGLAFVVLFLGSLAITNGNLLKGNLSPENTGLAYWLPQILILGSGALSGGTQFSFLSAPAESDGYLSSFLSQTEPPVKSIVNNDLAPGAENYGIAGFSYVFLLLILKGWFGDDSILPYIIAAVPASIIFALLHGQRQLSFLVTAFTIMLVSMTLYLYDRAKDGSLIGSLEASLIFTIGIHRGINLSSTGGLVEHYTTILQADGALIYVSYIVLLFDLMMAYYAVKSIYGYIKGDFSLLSFTAEKIRGSGGGFFG